MKKVFIIVLIVIQVNLVFSQITLKLTAIPTITPIQDTIFAAGTFNGWNPSDTSKILKRRTDGSYALTFTPSIGTHKFKFTRGSWATVEGTAQGAFMADRSFEYGGTAVTVSFKIDGWEGQSNQLSTASSNVSVIHTTFPMPQLSRTRRIWVYLPPQYKTDTTTRFPVFYLHDGQNLFDRTTSFSGEWQIDETLNKLSQQVDKGCIVVGIDNGGTNRLNEYSPWHNSRYGGGEGVAYGCFITETLKPYIDRQYRTKPDRLNTAVGGSSMGGLISMYIAAENQDIFSKAMIFSPSFWFNDSCYDHVVAKGNRLPMKYYLMAGQPEDNGSVVHALYKMEKMFIGIGLRQSQNYLIVPKADGQHSEWFWAREFEAAYKWLFSDITNSTSGIDISSKVNLSPNPTDSIIKLETNENLKYVNILIYDSLGRLMHVQPYRQGNIHVSFLKAGNYILVGAQGQNILFSKRWVKL